MPAVQDILSTMNQFAQARLPLVAGWRSGSAAASRSSIAGQPSSPVDPETADQPESAYAHAGPEPLLDEVLGDPVVQLIMQADRVQATDLRNLRAAVPRWRTTPIDPGAICPQ